MKLFQSQSKSSWYYLRKVDDIYLKLKFNFFYYPPTAKVVTRFRLLLLAGFLLPTETIKSKVAAV